MTTAADVLDRAIKVLRDDGWTRGRVHDPVTGGRCIGGAIRVATRQLQSEQSIDDLRWILENAARQQVRTVILEEYGSRRIPHVNDYLIRDIDEAIAVLKRAKDTPVSPAIRNWGRDWHYA